MTLHQLDTGLPVAQRTRIRDGLIARLAPLLRSSGLYVASIVPLAGVVRGPGDDDGLLELLEAMTGPCPLIGIALGRGVGAPNGVSTSGDRVLKTVDVHVYVASDNARSRIARMAQDAASIVSLAADPGIEIMLEHVEQQIHGFTVEDASGTIHGLKFVDEDEVWHAKDRTIWVVRYTSDVERNSNRNRDATRILTAIRTYHHEADAAAQNPLITSDTEIEP